MYGVYMGNATIDFTITSEVIITVISIIVTVIIAVIGGIYAIITNTKKYELTESYRQELLSWYINTIDIMIKIIHLIENQLFYSTSTKIELLPKLSTQIELGRFYFPNVIKGDSYGIKKPSAYQGYRHINLEFFIIIVFSLSITLFIISPQKNYTISYKKRQF